MDGAARRGRPGHDRETVLRTAIDLFNARGYDATSITDLATALGVTKSAVFHHVASKEELLGAALDEGLDALTRAVDSAAGSGGPAVDRLRATLVESVRILAAHLPAVTRLLRVRGNSPVEVDALRRRREIDDRLTALVAAAVAEGSLRDDVAPEVVSRLLFGTVNSLVEWYDPAGPLSPDALAATVATTALDGLARPGDAAAYEADVMRTGRPSRRDV